MTKDQSKPNALLRNAKAIIATLAAFGTALAVVIADPSTSALLPENWVQWIAAGAGALVALGAVFGIRNGRTVEQAQADLNRAVARQAKAKSTPARRRPRKRAARRAPSAKVRHPSAVHPSVAVDEVGRHRADDEA